MAWVTIEIENAEKNVGSLNEQCIELSGIAKEYFYDCWDMQYFGFHPGKDIFFYVTNLKRWCGNGKWYKLDFYHFQEEYFLCLRRYKNDIFCEDNLPSKIKQGITKLFSHRKMMKDGEPIKMSGECDCILLMKDAEMDKVVLEFRKLMNYLRDV